MARWNHYGSPMKTNYFPFEVHRRYSPPKSPLLFAGISSDVGLRVYFLALRSGSGSRIEIPSFVRLSWRFMLPFGGTKVLLVGVTSWFHPSWSRSYYEVECSMFHVFPLLSCWLLLWFVASVPPSFLYRIFFRATRSSSSMIWLECLPALGLLSALRFSYEVKMPFVSRVIDRVWLLVPSSKLLFTNIIQPR